MNGKTKEIALIGMLVALALIFSYVEVLIPFNFGIPGVKLGIANLVVVLAMYKISVKSAFIINILRMILIAAMFGNVAALLYSLSGGILSFLVMVGLKKIGKFSVIGVSMAGGVFHNLGQILIATAVIENLKVIYLIPTLTAIGMVTGVLIGVIARGCLISLYSQSE